MDEIRFDSLTRSLTTARSRRRALGGLLTGVFGVLSRPEPEEAAAHDLKDKCKKKSGEAKKKCLKKAKQHAAQHARQTPPPGPCIAKPNDAACNGNGRCLNGVCNPKPQCLDHEAACFTPGECCSGLCQSFINNCDPRGAANGSPCHSGFDCRSGYCLGYRGRGGICPFTADNCKTGTETPTCGDGGFCLQTILGGGARCGRHDGSIDGSMCDCTSDADCIDRTGVPGAFCAEITGGVDSQCSCPGGTAGTFCATPR
jgi:hypothetical protein